MIDGTDPNAATPAAAATAADPAAAPPADAGTPPATLVTGEDAPAAATPPAGDPAGEPEKKVEAAAPAVVPDKYDLKLPEQTSLGTAVVERTAAIARELGLSQDNAQKTLEFVNTEVAAQLAAVTEAHQPGGAEWTKNVEGWEAAALADPDLGGSGKPEVLKANAALAQRVLASFFPPTVKEFLVETGFGSNPDVLRGFVKIGRAMSEGSLVTAAPAATAAATPEEKAQRMYPSMAKKD